MFHISKNVNHSLRRFSVRWAHLSNVCTKFRSDSKGNPPVDAVAAKSLFHPEKGSCLHGIHSPGRSLGAGHRVEGACRVEREIEGS
jgi:hypothetical protein